MKYPVTLGVVCLARKTFDFNAAAGLYEKILADLAAAEGVRLVTVPGLVFEPEEARKAGDRLAAAGVDAVACISGTFHLGHLALEIRARVRRPLLLWGLPELPYDGGKIRLNSVCGVNLNASNLYKAGVDDCHVQLGLKIDEDWLDAIRVSKALASSRVGLLGFRAHGFFNLSVHDPSLFQETGILLDHYELEEVWRQPVEDSAVAARREKLLGVFDVATLSKDQIDKVALLAAKFDGFLSRTGLDVLAVRCWPEFAAGFGVAPCAAMSLLQGEGKILACEGDVEGALSMLAQRAAGGETPFLFDFSQIDTEADFSLFWHCGVAPCNLWDGKSVRSLDTYFAGGKGVTADFVLKEGPISILRIDYARGNYRLFLTKARAVPMTKDLRGTYLKAVFDRPAAEVMQALIENGFAHHASLVYGDFIKPFRILAKLKGWKVTEC